jgi:hypothetical protein
VEISNPSWAAEVQSFKRSSGDKKQCSEKVEEEEEEEVLHV